MRMTMFKTTNVATTTVKRSDEYKVVRSDEGLGYNQPQLAGRKLWLPMFLMAPMRFALAFILGVVEANTSRSDIADVQTLRHLVPAFMFVGSTPTATNIDAATTCLMRSKSPKTASTSALGHHCSADASALASSPNVRWWAVSWQHR
jgi:hypothetical protein